MEKEEGMGEIGQREGKMKTTSYLSLKVKHGLGLILTQPYCFQVKSCDSQGQVLQPENTAKSILKQFIKKKKITLTCHRLPTISIKL